MRDRQAGLKGEVALGDAAARAPVFELLAERYLDPAYGPDAVAAADRDSRRRPSAGSPPSWPRPRSPRRWSLDQPWTDCVGRRHERMIGRPVGMHAMRGISAHSNGFHTCRALHLLQMLLGSIDAPGGFRFKPPFPSRSRRARSLPGGRARWRRAGRCRGCRWAFRTGPRICWSRPTAAPCRIDKAFSWEAPLAAHGLMHMVITNACNGDPYPIDTLFLYMANMAWNSAMNVGGTLAMLTARDPATGEYRIPHIIYVGCLLLGDGGLCRPGAARHDLSRALGLHLAARPADLARPTARRTRSASRCWRPTATCGRSRTCCSISATGWACPGMTDERREPALSRRLPRLPGPSRAQARDRLLAGWRGDGGPSTARASPTRDQLERYIENGCFWQDELAPGQRYFKHANRDYLD